MLVWEDLSEHIRRLLGDTCIGNRIDDALKVIPICMSQCKAQTRHRFPTSCRHSQTKESWILFSGFKAMLVNFCSQIVESTPANLSKFLLIPGLKLQQDISYRKRIVAKHGFACIKMLFSIQKISVY